MDLTKRAKEELEHRIKDVEDFIAEKGFGSSYLNRAKRMQRNVNIAIVVGSIITIGGILVWAMSGSDKEE